jgi:hypothetical protein
MAARMKRQRLMVVKIPQPQKQETVAQQTPVMKVVLPKSRSNQRRRLVTRELPVGIRLKGKVPKVP